MQIPAKISFHNMDPSASLTSRIREKIAKLDQRFSGIMGCNVIVEAAHHHQTKGRLYSVRIDVTIPNDELVVSLHPGKDPIKHEKVFAAMNNAFAAIVRQLERYKDNRRRDIKSREDKYQYGVVSNISPIDEYGFITTQDQGEVYFHKNSVASDNFGKLDIGSHVRFIIADDSGRDGPQASVVKVSAKG